MTVVATPGSPIRVGATDGVNPRERSMQPVRSHIRAQAMTCAVMNAVLNPAVAWLGDRRMAFGLLAGDNSIIVDTAVTWIALSPLVPLFVILAARQEFRPVDSGKATRS